MNYKTLLAATGIACLAAASFAADYTVKNGEFLTLMPTSEYNAAGTTIVIEAGGTVTNTLSKDESPAEFKCSFDLKDATSTLVIHHWARERKLSGAIKGCGVIRCCSLYNNAGWSATPNTQILGDLSEFTGTFDLGDMPIRIATGKDAEVNLACVQSAVNWSGYGGGLALGKGQKVSVGKLEWKENGSVNSGAKRFWAKGEDATSVLSIGDASALQKVIVAGDIGLKTADGAQPLPFLVVTNNAAVTLLGGDFVQIDGAQGVVNVSNGTAHVYKPSADVAFRVLSGGTLEFGNSEELAKASPALWLDAADDASLSPFVINGNTSTYTNDSVVIRRWSDRRTTQTALYAVNPFMTSSDGKGAPRNFPFCLTNACNGLPVMSFGSRAEIDVKYGQTETDGTPVSGSWTLGENRRLMLNKALSVKWAIMVYGGMNKPAADGMSYFGGYVPASDACGDAGSYQKTFQGTEESEWTADVVSYGDVSTNYFYRGNSEKRILSKNLPTWADGVSVTASSTDLSGDFQILSIDSRQRTNGYKDLVEGGTGALIRGIGTRGNDGYNCGGQVYGEILLFSDDVTTVQRLAVEAYLAQKWRVPGYDFCVANVTVEDGGKFMSASSLLPNGIGLGSSLAFDVKDGAVVNPMTLDVEADAFAGGTIKVNFATARPKAGKYEILKAKKINRLDPLKWNFETSELSNRKAKFVWEKNAEGDVVGVSVEVTSGGMMFIVR